MAHTTRFYVALLSMHFNAKYAFKVKNVLCAYKVDVLPNVNNDKTVYRIYIKTRINFIIYCDDVSFKLH